MNISCQLLITGDTTAFDSGANIEQLCRELLNLVGKLPTGLVIKNHPALVGVEIVDLKNYEAKLSEEKFDFNLRTIRNIHKHNHTISIWIKQESTFTFPVDEVVSYAKRYLDLQ